MSAITRQNESARVDSARCPWLKVVRRQVSSLRFGVVQIVVHDGRVVQIERTEKARLGRPHCDFTR
jgi:hypothetical protein